jgi:hypothetical protein
MMTEGFKMVTGKEMMEEIKNLQSNGVWWEHNKKHLSAYKKVKGKKRELYWIPRDRCQTKDEQIDWVNQIAGKNWGDRYKFTNALKEACQNWGTW